MRAVDQPAATHQHLIFHRAGYMATLLLSALGAVVVVAVAAPPKMVAPSWDAPMPHSLHCIHVADYNPPGPPLPPGPPPPPSPWDPNPKPQPPPPKPYTVKNDSRWVFVALPKGTPPAGGWPVLVDLAIIDFRPPNGTKEKCGLDGVFPPGENPGFRRSLLEGKDNCSKAMYTLCGKEMGTKKCGACLSMHKAQLKQAGCLPEEESRACSKGKPRGFGIVEEYPPFATPGDMMGQCSCFEKNGTYGCGTTVDDGRHKSPGTGCSFDFLAGVMWFQRQKQFLLANGIAVMVANTRTFDGWNIDEPTYKTGEDPPFFKQLSSEMGAGKLGPLNQKRVAFHGWSGGAQMVSNVVDVWARGRLADIEVKAGVMMSGGTHQCYNIGNRTQAQCKGCDESEDCKTTGCSADPSTVGPNGKVCCYMCCPQGVTESYFQEHPEEYAKHPAMFLGQVSHDDQEADGCAARYYHETMQAHNATSEMQLIPLHEQRCYCVGQPGEPALNGSAAGDGADSYARYCRSQDPQTGAMLNCQNHSVASAEMVVPLTRFLMKAL
jgi:hypothetical protein